MVVHLGLISSADGRTNTLPLQVASVTRPIRGAQPLVVIPVTWRCLVGNPYRRLFLTSALLLLVQHLLIVRLLLQTHSLHLLVLISNQLRLTQEILLKLRVVVLASHFSLLPLGLHNAFVAVHYVSLLQSLLVALLQMRLRIGSFGVNLVLTVKGLLFR